MPITAHTIEREDRAIDVDINGDITLQFLMDIDLPKENPYVFSVLLSSDFKPRTTPPFS